jgi:hypothetical protein
LFSIIIASSQAFAWGPDGHHTVGAIADRLIAGSNAATEVKNILGDLNLQDASVWADCAKVIDPSKDFTYQTPGKYPECKIYETPALEEEMSDFVRRNDTNCSPKPSGEACHNEYHYTDIAIQNDHYDPSFVGARNDDIVAAIVAAMHVLKGDPAPAPFSFKNKREALLVLAHYVGDIHQPLHVGAIYLDSKGKRVNPDAGTFDPKTGTRGGNDITIKGKNQNMHALWDEIPASQTVSYVNATLIKKAAAIPTTNGQLFDWPASWAGETIGAAGQAYQGLKFGNLQNNHWSTTLPATYGKKIDGIKQEQLVKAGARLAQLLQAIFPTSTSSVSFRFAMTDDSRAAGSAAAQNNGVSTVVIDAIARDIAAQNAAQKIDFLLFPGDMVTGETNDSAALGSMMDAWNTAMAPVYNANIPVYTARGNHEYNPLAKGASNPADPSLATYQAHFPMPTDGPPNETGLTYSFIDKNAKFIVFDAYAGRKTTFNNTLYASGANKGQMMNPWVIDQINSSTSGVNFVMAHEQMWPSNSHPDCLANDPDSRDALVHALGTHNGAYLAGHDHMYVRGIMTNGSGDKVPSFVVGSGGGGNYDYAPFTGANYNYGGSAKYNVQKSISSSANPTFGYMLVTVYSDNTWSAQFRGFQFNKWNDATDVSLTPFTVLDSFTNTDSY